MDWYQHPTMSNVRANGCGVLEVGGKMSIGHKSANTQYYTIRINNKSYLVHRLLAECYFGNLLNPEDIVDHIIPISEDCNNNINNLRVGTKKDNMNNELTRQKFQTKTYVYDLFGKLISTYPSKKEAMIESGCTCLNNGLMANKDLIIVEDGEDIDSKTQFIYYKYEVGKDSVPTLVSANAYLGKLSNSEGTALYAKIKKYVNTGMVAPDGFLYQQGYPNQPLYDPTNTSLLKKREDTGWRNRYK